MIDCFFIGHNEMDFARYEQSVRDMGVSSGAYRDLQKNFIRYNNKPYYASQVFNLFCTNHTDNNITAEPIGIGENFNTAIAYLGTWLDKRGYTFDYVNSFQEEKKELAEKLAQNNILTIAIITTLYVSVFPILEIVSFIKQYNTTAKIILGGPFVSNQIRKLEAAEVQYLFQTIGADFYVNSSQGEAALVKIIRALKNQIPIEQIVNTYYKTPKGYLSTGMERENNQLSSNMVNWDMFSRRLGKFVSVRFAISCPFSCSFCGFPEHAGPFQTATVEAVEKELNQLNQIPAVQCIQVIDDTFNIPQKRYKEILKMMIKNQYRFKWHAHVRCQYLDRETTALMKESGCEGVFLGIESGSDQILKNMNKAVTVEKYLRGIALLKEYEILTFGSFITGFPGETAETVEETINFIKNSGLDLFRTQLWYCDPVTPIWKQKEKYRIKGSHFEWSHATMDSKQACDIIDDIFLSIDAPLWVPQYNFEFDTIFHLLHRGLTLQQVKRFTGSFCDGIREKIKTPSKKEVSLGIIKQIRESCQKNNENNMNYSPPSKRNIVEDFNADFDL